MVATLCEALAMRIGFKWPYWYHRRENVLRGLIRLPVA
jgi:hypothetical protein